MMVHVVSVLGMLLLVLAIRFGMVARARQRELQRLHGEFQMLYDSAPDMMASVDPGTGIIFKANETLATTLGFATEDLVGRHVSALYPPESRAAVDEACALFRTAGVVPTAPRSLQHRDLTRIEVNQSAYAVRDRRDKILFASWTWRVVNEQKRAERRFRGLLDAAPDAMIIVDGEGTIVRMNRAAEILFGYSAEELVGRPVKVLVPDRQRASYLDYCNRYRAPPRKRPMGPETAHFDGRRKNGTEFPTEITLSPLETEEGILTTAAVRDISEMKAAQQELARQASELERSNEELQQFAYVASHDLQEPLRMISSYTQLLAQRYAGKLDSEADEFIAFAVDGAQRMQKLIEDLLHYSRVNTRNRPSTTVQLREAAEQALRHLQPLIADHHAQISLADVMPTALGDEAQFVQLFQNLIGNAVKYRGDDPPEVRITVASGTDQMQIGVQDNGIGIAPQDRHRIFELFRRLHHTDQYDGTGIGLAVCKRIVERHGGRIWVESEPGIGSTFWFTLGEESETGQDPQH